ncbi:MAG: MmcQ/YjbR family DNA-binding protein [Chitinophagaceae bacterium]|nr:MAG: MmcQ/YjbR family DNA-binding protein [Chitinophagaceae bacterium]
MIDLEAFRHAALSFPGATEAPHFDKPSYRFRGKIFATCHAREHRAVLKLPVVAQSVFCAAPASPFCPVPGSWGAQGYTFVDLATVPAPMFRDALEQAYRHVAGTGR